MFHADCQDRYLCECCASYFLWLEARGLLGAEVEHSNYHEGFYATGMFSQASADISAESLHIDYT
jgi:hypothetical protein